MGKHSRRISKDKKEEVLAYLLKHAPDIDIQDTAILFGVNRRAVQFILASRGIPYISRAGYHKKLPPEKKNEIIRHLKAEHPNIDIGGCARKFGVSRCCINKTIASEGLTSKRMDGGRHEYDYAEFTAEEVSRIQILKAAIADGTYWVKYPIGSVGLFNSVLSSLSKV